MISLRELHEKDAILMLEWMHNPVIQKSFKKNMLDANLEDTIKFCISSKVPTLGEIKSGDSIHMAIVDENDEYLGTVSLKDINWDNMTAEYAITTREKVHGKGVAFKATGLILRKAFKEYGLHRVYLNVFSDNEAAIRLYERAGFRYEGEFREHIKMGEEYKDWKWYGMLENEYDTSLFINEIDEL